MIQSYHHLPPAALWAGGDHLQQLRFNQILICYARTCSGVNYLALRGGRVARHPRMPWMVPTRALVRVAAPPPPPDCFNLSARRKRKSSGLGFPLIPWEHSEITSPNFRNPRNENEPSTSTKPSKLPSRKNGPRRRKCCEVMDVESSILQIQRIWKIARMCFSIWKLN